MEAPINRRSFMQASSSALLASGLNSITGRSLARSPGELRVIVWGGDTGKAIIESIVKPFEAVTGINVIPITDATNLVQIELMVTTNSVTVDVVGTDQNIAFAAAKKGLFEQIDYSIYRKQELEGFQDYFRQPFGVAAMIDSSVMVYNTQKYPASKRRPTSWAEYWDVESFPGVRMLNSGFRGSDGPWEEALLADGVAADALYPMNIDRVFASLNRIKPHVRRWWANGSEIQQIMRGGLADLTNSYDGRAATLMAQGVPIEINWNQAKLGWEYWVIPKGSPNVGNAQKFIEFATRADRQADFAQRMLYAPPNAGAFRLIPDDVARKLATYPDYIAKSIRKNMDWYAEVGSDGVTNTERLGQRWNDWILR